MQQTTPVRNENDFFGAPMGLTEIVNPLYGNHHCQLCHTQLIYTREPCQSGHFCFDLHPGGMLETPHPARSCKSSFLGPVYMEAGHSKLRKCLYGKRARNVKSVRLVGLARPPAPPGIPLWLLFHPCKHLQPGVRGYNMLLVITRIISTEVDRFRRAANTPLHL